MRKLLTAFALVLVAATNVAAQEDPIVGITVERMSMDSLFTLAARDSIDLRITLVDSLGHEDRVILIERMRAQQQLCCRGTPGWVYFGAMATVLLSVYMVTNREVEDRVIDVDVNVDQVVKQRQTTTIWRPKRRKKHGGQEEDDGGLSL